jgi:glycine cleavage system H protein
MYPQNFRYTKEHEWVAVENGVGTVGITDHAQHELGDIVYVEVPKVGTHVEQGKSFAVVESVKAASEIYAPVSGEIVEANEALANTPELLNSSPHEGGWIAKIKLSAPEEVDRLLSPADYEKYVGQEQE